jgi:alkylation response protein AidB-like acyl-CoA dehydrogenase
MAVRAEAARSQLFMAAMIVEGNLPDAQEQAVAAKLVATDAAVRNSSDNIQNHGGMGFAYDNTAHLYLRRARVYQELFGGTAFARDYLVGMES